MNCTIIIPVIKVNKLLLEVVKKCSTFHSNLPINIVFNKKSKDFALPKRVKLIKTLETNISTKRNIGVRKANTRYIAFLDSDAYPERNWFKNATKILEKDLSVGIVTGPEISFPNQNFIENAVGISNRSFLITGAHNFRKSLTKSRFYSEASACNMIMRKVDYESLNGMNSKIYLGEDQEFSNRIIKQLNKTIFFSNNVRVYHKDRDLKGYLVQRFARGIASTGFFFKLKNFCRNISLNNFLNQRFETCIPLFFVCFLITIPFSYLFDTWRLIYFFILSLYFILIFLEALKLNYNNLKYFSIVYVLLILGTIVPGCAQLSKLINFKINIENFYRNKNDE